VLGGDPINPKPFVCGVQDVQSGTGSGNGDGDEGLGDPEEG
jgi:hypothetical protein